MKLIQIVKVMVLSTLATVATGLVAQADGVYREDCAAGSYPGYAIENFRDQQRQMLDWNQRYNQASSGSWEERNADQMRRQYGEAALSQIQYGQALSKYPQATIESFAQEMDQLYNSASSGSYLENVYNRARAEAWTQYEQKGMFNVSCYLLTYRDTLDVAYLYDQKYNAASSGSTREGAYRRLAQAAYDTSNANVRRYLQYVDSPFRDIQQLAYQFEQSYNAASSGSKREAFYRDARVLAFDRALELARQQLRYVSRDELYRTEQEYNACYNSASSGSKRESFCRAVRDEARNLISSPYPTPAPYPAPAPYPVPNPGPVPHPAPVPAPMPYPYPTGQIQTMDFSTFASDVDCQSAKLTLNVAYVKTSGVRMSASCDRGELRVRVTYPRGSMGGQLMRVPFSAYGPQCQADAITMSGLRATGGDRGYFSARCELINGTRTEAINGMIELTTRY